jgi:molecular chaperone DnaK (HSP70)
VKQNDRHETQRGFAALDAESAAYRGSESAAYRGSESAAYTAHSIGIEVHGGRAIVLIPAGSRTPVARAMTFTTVTDGQRAVEVRVVRCAGESARPSGVIGRFLVPGLRTGLRGEARIDIGISLDREGLIRAWGADRSTGARQEATFAGLWALAPQARPRALAELARRVDDELSRPEFESAPGLRNEAREMRDREGQDADGPALAALAGEIRSIHRSSAEPPVRI